MPTILAVLQIFGKLVGIFQKFVHFNTRKTALSFIGEAFGNSPAADEGLHLISGYLPPSPMVQHLVYLKRGKDHLFAHSVISLWMVQQLLGGDFQFAPEDGPIMTREWVGVDAGRRWRRSYRT